MQIDLLEMEDKATKHALYLCDYTLGNLLDKHWVFNMLLAIFPLDDLDIPQTRLTSLSHQKLKINRILQYCLLFWGYFGINISCPFQLALADEIEIVPQITSV